MDGLLKYGPMVVVGMVLGAVFFGGLWVTVRQIGNAKRPGLLFLTSVAVRSAIVLGGIGYFAAGDAISIAACMLGFVSMRVLSTQGISIFGAAFGVCSDRVKSQ